MTTATVQDPSEFSSMLDFDRDALSVMRAQIHSDKDTRKHFETLLRADDGSSQGKEALGHATAAWLLSQPDVCVKILERAGESSQASLLGGLASLETSDPASAVAALTQLIGTSMECDRFFVDLATAAATTGDADLAMKAARKLPEGAHAAYAEGIALEAEGEYVEASKRYEAAIEADPQHVRALFRLALRRDLQGDEKAAVELYRRCVAVPPGHVNALLNLALLCEDAGRYTEAEACYRRVLRSDPQHVRAQIGLKDVQASQSMYYDEDHERREDRRAQVLRTPITEFELSVRSRNCLAKMHITTLGDLVRKTEPELLAYKNFGETSLQEIKDILAQKNLRLGMLTEDETPLGQAPSVASAEAQLDALFGGGEGGGEDPRERPIEVLDLSIRARRCMENLEIRTVGELMSHSETELLASKNFGQTSLNEIRRKLDDLGLSLKRK